MSLTNASGGNTFTPSEYDEEEHFIQEDETQVLSTTTTLLHATAVNGNKRLLQNLLQDDIKFGKNDEINRGDQFGRTPLVYSVLGDRLECAKLLILYAASVSMGDVDGRTPLHWAAYQGSHKCVKLLLSKGADWKAKDTKGRTPLHFAASHQSSKCLSVLLKRVPKGDVQVDDPDNDSMTALHWGASYGNAEHVKMLLKARASVKLLDLEKKTPLHWGTTNQNPSVVKLILEQTNEIINWQDIEGRTALHLAVARHNEAVVKTLLAVEKCNTSVQDNMNRTPLHWAAVLGNSRIVKLLLRREADYSLVDGNGATALHYAAHGDHVKTAEVLLSFHNIQDTPDNEGRTALIWAAGKGASSALEAMLNHHLDVHNTDNSGRTALHVAAYSGDVKCVEILLLHGASVNALDELNHTPLFRACEMGYADVVNVLKQNKAILDLEDQDGRSPLHWASLNGHAHICFTLVTNGVQANRGDRLGCTPLHCAAYGGFVNCMSVLIDNGADVNKLDEEGISALHWCCSSGHLEAVKLLLRKGAFPNFYKLDGERLTPLDYAILGDHQDVAQYMIEQGGLTINAIQDVAATTIQSCWRGYRVRKPFQKRKTLYMRHEQLKRDMKRRASAVKEEELKDKLQMIRETASSPIHELNADHMVYLTDCRRRRALCHRTSGEDGGYFKLELQLEPVRTNNYGSNLEDVESRDSIGQRFVYGESDEEYPFALPTILEGSYPQEVADDNTANNLENEVVRFSNISGQNENIQESKMEMTDTSEMKNRVGENPEEIAPGNNDDLTVSIYEILEKKSPTCDSNFNAVGGLTPTDQGNRTLLTSHGAKDNCVLSNGVDLTPVDCCQGDPANRQKELVIFQHKSEYARKERERRNLIRAKMEAATAIQRWYRRHRRVTQEQHDDTLAEVLRDQEELIRQVAALTIQLCWRKFLSKEYKQTAQRFPNRNSENARFRESNKITTSPSKPLVRCRNKTSVVRGSIEDPGSRRSRIALPNSGFVRHRRTAMTLGNGFTALDMYSPTRKDTRTSTAPRRRRPTGTSRTSKSIGSHEGGSYGRRSKDSWKN